MKKKEKQTESEAGTEPKTLSDVRDGTRRSDWMIRMGSPVRKTGES